jgi:2-keto-3-deoxy-L-rhamnonate aldolase RhmA
MSNSVGENQAKRKLAAGELTLFMGVNQMRTPNIAMIAAACGFDGVYIDLETPEAIENAEAIAAVDGIDVVHIGSTDLSTEMGIPGQYRHVRMREAYETTGKAAKSHEKSFAVGGVRDDLEFQTWLLANRNALPDRRARCRLHPQRRPGRGEADTRSSAHLRLSTARRSPP